MSDSMYQNEYYWDVLMNKYNIATQSGFSKCEEALKSWFRKHHKVEMVNFAVSTVHGIALDSEIQIEVPVDRMGIPSGLSSDEFIDLVEGPEQDEFNDAGLAFLEGLLNFERVFSGWDMQQDSEDPDMVVITYFLG